MALLIRKCACGTRLPSKGHKYGHRCHKCHKAYLRDYCMRRPAKWTNIDGKEIIQDKFLYNAF